MHARVFANGARPCSSISEAPLASGEIETARQEPSPMRSAGARSRGESAANEKSVLRIFSTVAARVDARLCVARSNLSLLTVNARSCLRNER